MGDHMAKATRKSKVSENPTTTESSTAPEQSGTTMTSTEEKKRKDAERKAAEEQVRMRHVEGLRKQMISKGIDVDNMKDPGFMRLNPEVWATPLAKSGGVKVGRKLSAGIPSLFGVKSPHMQTTVSGYKGRSSGFRRLLGKILRGSKEMLGIGDKPKQISVPPQSKMSPDISGLAFLKKRSKK